MEQCSHSLQSRMDCRFRHPHTIDPPLLRSQSVIKPARRTRRVPIRRTASDVSYLYCPHYSATEIQIPRGCAGGPRVLRTAIHLVGIFRSIRTNPTSCGLPALLVVSATPTRALAASRPIPSAGSASETLRGPRVQHPTNGTCTGASMVIHQVLYMDVERH
jgi:hypothetical protein